MQYNPLRRVIGVDPGASGGIARLTVSQSVSVDFAVRMPMLRGASKPTLDAQRALQLLCPDDGTDDIIVIERVHSMPGQGVASSFQFGRMFGAIEAVARATGTKVVTVLPKRWKGDLGLGRDKRESIDMAKRVFGTQVDDALKRRCDDGVAEALLIAYHHLGKYP